jgi:hypothetical protein
LGHSPYPRRGVTFRSYPGAPLPVLRGLNLQSHPVQRLASSSCVQGSSHKLDPKPDRRLSDTYKTRLVPALGITKSGMRLVSRYLRVKKSEVVRVLDKLSVIAVAAGCHPNRKPEYRQNFRGVRYDCYGLEPPVLIRHGYLFEKRRCMGGSFK